MTSWFARNSVVHPMAHSEMMKYESTKYENDSRKRNELNRKDDRLIYDIETGVRAGELEKSQMSDLSLSQSTIAKYSQGSQSSLNSLNKQESIRDMDERILQSRLQRGDLNVNQKQNHSYHALSNTSVLTTSHTTLRIREGFLNSTAVKWKPEKFRNKQHRLESMTKQQIRYGGTLPNKLRHSDIAAKLASQYRLSLDGTTTYFDDRSKVAASSNKDEKNRSSSDSDANQAANCHTNIQYSGMDSCSWKMPLSIATSMHSSGSKKVGLHEQEYDMKHIFAKEVNHSKNLEKLDVMAEKQAMHSKELESRYMQILDDINSQKSYFDSSIDRHERQINMIAEDLIHRIKESGDTIENQIGLCLTNFDISVTNAENKHQQNVQELLAKSEAVESKFSTIADMVKHSEKAMFNISTKVKSTLEALRDAKATFLDTASSYARETIIEMIRCVLPSSGLNHHIQDNIQGFTHVESCIITQEDEKTYNVPKTPIQSRKRKYYESKNMQKRILPKRSCRSKISRVRNDKDEGNSKESSGSSIYSHHEKNYCVTPCAEVDLFYNEIAESESPHPIYAESSEKKSQSRSRLASQKRQKTFSRVIRQTNVIDDEFSFL